MIIVRQGPRPDDDEHAASVADVGDESGDTGFDDDSVVDDGTVTIDAVKNPPIDSSRLISTLNQYGARLRELEKPSGSQTSVPVDVLPPYNGGTGTSNAYENALDTGTPRSVSVLEDGTLGTVQSSRKVKTDFHEPYITLEQLRSVDWKGYRYIRDVNLNSDSAQWHVGMIAEELDDAGLGSFVEYDGNDEPCGIDYQMLGVWAIHEAHLAHDRIDALEKRVKELEDKINGVA